MKPILLIFSFTLILNADICDELFVKSKKSYTEIQAIFKTNIASHEAYKRANDYIDLTSSAIASCSTSESRDAFRNTRELTANMQVISQKREGFRVSTFNELKAEAMVQAKKEAQCTKVYNNTYIRRNSDRPNILPIKN